MFNNDSSFILLFNWKAYVQRWKQHPFQGSQYMSKVNMANELKGNTLRVYWYLLGSSNNFVGPRQIQRELNFSSPALAVYHLDKLMELGLVEKKSGEYHIKEVVDVGILKQFMKWGNVIIPRYVTYATMISVLFVFFISQLREINFYSLFALIFGSLSTAIFWFETIKVWRSRPKKKQVWCFPFRPCVQVIEQSVQKYCLISCDFNFVCLVTKRWQMTPKKSDYEWLAELLLQLSLLLWYSLQESLYQITRKLVVNQTNRAKQVF